ncbi:hypothetical protein EJ110_NYTH59646 [Nymphaea thermarum]|nr:hypothetical protein EJ110_NYTH59646 [Nymphaea thermarum]
MKSSPFSSLITKMNGGNYEMWAMQVKRTLIAHDKEHLILEPEPVQKVGKYGTWFKDNSLAMVWIVGTLSQDIANEVLHKESAKDMWDSLAATYSQARNKTRIMQLHHDIHQMRQDGRPLHTYYSSPKSMFERLNSYFPAFANQTASTESPEQPKAQHTVPSSELRVDDLLSQLRSLIGDRPQHAPDPTTTTVTTAASASSSGMYSAYTACPATDTTDWLIDSGASTHLCGDKAQFTSYVSAPPGRSVILADGKVQLTSSLPLQHVLHAPEFPHSLLSISQITRDLHCRAIFDSSSLVFQDILTGRVIGSGREQGGLYRLNVSLVSWASIIGHRFPCGPVEVASLFLSYFILMFGARVVHLTFKVIGIILLLLMTTVVLVGSFL